MSKGTFVISLDFELFWGMQDCCSLESYQENVLGGRKAIKQLLKLFTENNIHATWATVGFQFASNYDELKDYFPPVELRPTYLNRRLSSYRCFKNIGKDEKEAPCFYSPSLISKIAECDGQEIGSHTFSHYYCREKGQTIQQFKADMIAAKKLAAAHGYNLSSVVLPRNQSLPEYISVLRELGFTAYRDEENDWIHKRIKKKMLKRGFRLLDVYFPITGQGGYIPRNENGIINLVGSRMYKPFFKPLFFMEQLKIFRIKRQMLHAAKKGYTFHLWWHPHNIGCYTEYHLHQLQEIINYYQLLKDRYGMRSLNMREAAEEILSR